MDLTQLQLADQLGITDKAISKWERGLAMPDTSVMVQLCSILNISVDELLSGEKSMVGRTEQLLLGMAKEIEQKTKQSGIQCW